MIRELALMKRVLLLLMMLILPLQSAWASSDVDCQARPAAACEHGAADTSTDDNGPTQASAHLDDGCACHLGHVDALSMGVHGAAPSSTSPDHARVQSSVNSYITPPPERPQWA